jgi:hypothetical protein
MDLKKFGQTSDEIIADDMVVARQIVSVVLDYGITQEQIVRIIKLLGLELVNHDHMKLIVTAAKSIEESDDSQNIII